MEHIDFTYVFKDKDSEEKAVHISKRDENGLLDHEVCELFLDFMRTVGYSEENVFKFFQQ